jgi:hypothetical protein
MTTFTANRGGTFTPVAHATNMNNVTVAADTAGDIGRVISLGWGGRGTTPTGYRTRWARAVTNGGTPTALTLSSSNPNATAVCSANTYTTAPIGPADPAGLFVQDWNVVGGGGYIVLPLSGGWWYTGTAAPYAQIACGNIAGVDADQSSYSTTWEE